LYTEEARIRMHYGNAAFCFYRREIELIQRMRWDSFPSNDGCLWQKGGKMFALNGNKEKPLPKNMHNGF